jgi:hypothetical protein
MTETTKEFSTEFTRFVDSVEGLGDSRLVPLPLEWNSLTWGCMSM